MITISTERKDQLIDFLYELESQNQCHYDHFRRGELDEKSSEIYEMIGYLEMADELNEGENHE